MPLTRRHLGSSAVKLAAANGLVIVGRKGCVAAIPTKRWASADELWVDESSHAGCAVLAVAVHPNGIAITCDEAGTAFAHDGVFDTNPRHTLLGRFAAVIRDVQIDPTGTTAYLAGASLCAVDLTTMTVQTISLPLPPPLCAVALSPRSEMVAVGCTSRGVAVAPLREGMPKTVHNNCLDAAVRTMDTVDVKLAWLDETTFAVPCTEGVRVFTAANSGFRLLTTLPTEQAAMSLVAARHSKHLTSLIIVTADGSTVRAKLDATHGYKSRGVTKLHGTGTFACASWCIDASDGSAFLCNDAGACLQVTKAVKAVKADDESDGDVTASEDFEEVVGDLIRDNPRYRATGKSKRPENRQLQRAALASAKELIDDEAEVSEDSEDDDEDAAVAGDDVSHSAGDVMSEHEEDADSLPSQAAETHGTAARPHVCHPPVRVGSTAPDASGKRYLAFNSIGAIRETPESGIVISFHDKGRSQLRVQHKGVCVCAAVGVSAAALAFEHREAEACSIEVVVKTFASASTGAQDWSIQLPPYEQIIAVAQCKRFTVVVTSDVTRVFSWGGVEVAVFATVNTIAAVGMNTARCTRFDNADPLCVVQTTADGLSLKVLNADDNGAVLEPPVSVPLPGYERGTTLKWIGWSDDGALHIQDSRGVVSALTHDWGTSWSPVLDPRARPEFAGAWAWGASDDKIWVVMCGADGQEPPVTAELPTPEFVTALVPVLRGGGSDRATLLRAVHMRKQAKLNDEKRAAESYGEHLGKSDSALDRIMLKAFELELKATGNVARCLDMAGQLQLIESIEHAIRMAHEAEQTFLVDRLVTLASGRAAAKKRRLCKLPAEGTHVSDKERDRLLRRLLAKERAGAASFDRPPVESQPAKQESVPPAPAPLDATPVRRTETSASPSATKGSSGQVLATQPPAQPVQTQTASSARKAAFNPFGGGTVNPSPPKAAPTPKMAPPATPTEAPRAAAKQPAQKQSAGPKQPAVIATAASAQPPPPPPPPPTARDPFLTEAQARASEGGAGWKGLDLPSVIKDDLETRNQPSGELSLALAKRYRDDDEDDDEEEELRGLGNALHRAE